MDDAALLSGADPTPLAQEPTSSGRIESLSPNGTLMPLSGSLTGPMSGAPPEPILDRFETDGSA